MFFEAYAPRMRGITPVAQVSMRLSCKRYTIMQTIYEYLFIVKGSAETTPARRPVPRLLRPLKQ